MGLIILYFLGALSLSFLCSVLEAVLLSTPMSFITMKESQGNKTAALMKQYQKAMYSMLVTPAGMFIDVRLLQ